MKNLSLFKYLFLFAIAAVLLPSCGTDDTGGDNPTGPSISLLADTDIISEDETVAPGTAFTVRLNAITGEANLKSLTIYGDNAQLDANRIEIAGISLANNPQLITGDNVNGFTWDITLVAQSDLSTLTYDFDIADDNGTVATVSVAISTETTELPTITYNGNNPAVLPLGLNGFNLNIMGNGNVLQDIAVYEDNMLIDISRLRLGDSTFVSNPHPFSADDQDEYIGNVFVNLEEGNHDLTFEVTTTAGDMISTTVAYQTQAIGTALEGQYSAKIVYNASGPNFGGLDLNTGEVVSVNDNTADIIDSGIDVNGDWLVTIEPANGAEMVYLTQNLETFTFESVQTKEVITAAFDVEPNLTVISNTVQVGDLFVVRTGGKDYLLVVREVNGTSGDNVDSYLFDVKY